LGVRKERERIRAIEYWTICTLEASFKTTSEIDIVNFLSDMQQKMHEAVKVYTDELLNQEIQGLWKVEPASPRRLLADSFSTVINNYSDRMNLSAVINLMYSSDTYCCFAALDYNDLIRNRNYIYQEFYLNVSDPLYVPYLLRKLRTSRGIDSPKKFACSHPTGGWKIETTLQMKCC
jgi:hypothetical protein